jgi:hypothetical protein
MLARRVFSFHPPRLHASSCSPSKPFVSPTCKLTVRNSFVSPTYAKTGGCTPPKMSARRHFLSLFSQPHSRPSCFSITCALFHFPYPAYLPPFQYHPHSCPKNRGYTPSGPTNPSVPLPHQPPLPPFLPFPPFTAHSQSCYRTFTHPSPSLVTIIPGQGTNSYTMPIAIRMPTVHFYQCDPLREIPS